MKRSVAILLTALLIVTSMPAFANYDVMPTGAENLKHYKFIQGGTGGDLMVDMVLDRQQLAIIICELYGQRGPAAAYGGQSKFTDEAKFPAWARSFIAYARLQKWMNGLPDGSFDNLGPVSGQQLATAMLNVLGHEHKWGEGIAKLQSMGVFIPNQPALTRGQAFEAMWKIVSTPIMSDGKVLGEITGRLVPATPTPPPKPPVKKVELLSIRADNLTEIVAEFNEPIMEQDLKGENFRVGGVAGKLSLRGDGRTVVLVPSVPLVNQKEYTADIKGLRLAADPSIALQPIKEKFRAFDATLPKVDGVEFSGPRSITITFSEPIKVGGKIEIKSGTTSLSINAGSFSGYGTNRITAESYTNFREGTDYEIRIMDFEDYAGYRCQHGLVNIAYTKSGSAPTATVVDATQAYVRVKFDRPVKGLSPDNFWHTFNAYKAVKVTKTDNPASAAVAPHEALENVYVWFYIPGGAGNYPMPIGTVKFGVFGKALTSITDAWGTALADMQQTINVAGSVEPPTVTEIRMKSPNTMLLKFNTKVTMPTVKIVRSSGTALGNNYHIPTVAPSDEYEIVFSRMLDLPSVVITVKDAKEIGVNQLKMLDYATELHIGDVVAPTLDKVAYSLVGTQPYLIMFFSEPMGPSALTTTNYQLKNGASYLSLQGSAMFEPNSSTVKIPLSSSENAQVTVGVSEIFAANIKDEAGNSMQGRVLPIQDIAAATQIEVQESWFETPTEGVVVINQPISYINGIPFRYGGTDVKILSQEEVGSRARFRISIAPNEIPVANWDNPVALELVKDTLVGVHGNKNILLFFNAADRIPPRVKEVQPIAGGVLPIKVEGALAGDPANYAHDLNILGDGVKLIPAVHYTTAYNAGTGILSVQFEATNVAELGKNADALLQYSIMTVEKPNYILDANGNAILPYTKLNIKP